ncbi:MAG TPA: peptidoglycan DD-metalloendopeptidase family protein [Alphaproteobacteria bacterium]
MRAAAVAAAALFAAVPASDARAAEPADRLEDVERALGEARGRKEALEREAQALAQAAARIKRDSVAAARKAQDLESDLTMLEGEVARLAAAEREKAGALAAQRDRLARLLAAMERIARHPPAALIAEPAAPAEAVRSAILLRAAVPAVEDKAQALRAELAELAGIRSALAARRAKLDEGSRALAAERTHLARLVEGKLRLESRTRAESRDEAERAAELAAKAESLRELMARIEAGRKARPPAKPQSAVARAVPSAPPREGSLPFPARGDVARRFGADDASGGHARGITIRTRPGAQVIAPHDGEVVFAGPFRGFGHLLIIQNGEEYHALLGGLARIDAEIGQPVLAGEPVGVMDSSPAGEPALYFELRRKGQPINPLPFLAAGNSKVNG